MGKADAMFAVTGLMLDPAEKPEDEGAATAARVALGDEGFEAAYAAGAELDPSAL